MTLVNFETPALYATGVLSRNFIDFSRHCDFAQFKCLGRSSGCLGFLEFDQKSSSLMPCQSRALRRSSEMESKAFVSDPENRMALRKLRT